MVATNDTAELALIGTRRGQVQIVTHHFRMIEAPVVNLSLQHLIDRWQAAAQATWLLTRMNDYTFDKIRARHICGSQPLDATVEETVNTPGTAGAITNALPPWIAVVVRERTASAGKERRGRWYQPIDDEAHITAETITGAQQTAIQNYVTAMGAFLAGGAEASDYRLVVHSRKLAAVPGTQCDASSTLVTSLALQTTVTSQRSRRARPT